MGGPCDAEEPWADAHRQAVADGAGTYVDPATGYLVFTEAHHLARGSCCDSGCRHCPYRNTGTKGPSAEG